MYCLVILRLPQNRYFLRLDKVGLYSNHFITFRNDYFAHGSVGRNDYFTCVWSTVGLCGHCVVSKQWVGVQVIVKQQLSIARKVSLIAVQCNVNCVSTEGVWPRNYSKFLGEICSRLFYPKTTGKAWYANPFFPSLTLHFHLANNSKACPHPMQVDLPHPASWATQVWLQRPRNLFRNEDCCVNNRPRPWTVFQLASSRQHLCVYMHI